MVAGSSSVAPRSELDDGTRLETGWDRRRRRIADHIEQAAIELFAKRGYRQVSIEDVAAAAGISSRTVARYFPTKEDLLLARPRRGYDETLQALGAIGPTREPFTSAWQMWLRLTQEHKADLEDVLLWHAAAASAPEVVARALGEHQLALQAGLTALCAEALDSDPDSDPGPVVVAACIAAANKAIVDFWVSKQGQYDLEELFAKAIRTLDSELLRKRPSVRVTPPARAVRQRKRPSRRAV
jgi:AcrR family transcriptional regulator